MLSTVSNILYLTDIVPVFQKKSSNTNHLTATPKIKRFHLSKSSHQCLVVLSFTFLCFCSIVTETVFVVISCQDWLGLNISSDRQEAA